jgi:hypothetical protein
MRRTFATIRERISYFMLNSYYAIIHNDVDVFERNEEIDFDELLEKIFQMENEHFEQNPTTKLDRINRDIISNVFVDKDENHPENDIEVKMSILQLSSMDFLHLNNKYEEYEFKKHNHIFTFYLSNTTNLYQFTGLFLENIMLVKPNEYLYKRMIANNINFLYIFKNLQDYFINDYYVKKECGVCMETKHLSQICLSSKHECCFECANKIKYCPFCRRKIVNSMFPFFL